MNELLIPFKYWGPLEIHETYPSIGAALDELEGDLGGEASFAAGAVTFWRICFEPETRVQAETKLRTLEEALRAFSTSDEDPDPDIAAAYILIASSLVVSEVQGDRFSEATEEAMQRAFRAIRVFDRDKLKDALAACDDHVEFTVLSSLVTAAGLLHYTRATFLRKERRRREDALGEFEEALLWWDAIGTVTDEDASSYMPEECLNFVECPSFGGEACRSPLDLNELCLQQLWIEDQFQYYSMAAIFHWIRGKFLNLRDIADTFRELASDTTPVSSWRSIERLCGSLGTSRWYMDQRIQADGSTETDNPGGDWLSNLPLYWSEFWSHARGIAISRMSRSDYVELREFDKRTDAQDRLKAYFFPDSWEQLEPAIQNSLISADLTYRQTLGRRDMLADDLRLACEPILRTVLFDPFKDWSSSRGLPVHSEPPDPTLGRMLKIMWKKTTGRQLDEFLASLPLNNQDMKFLRKTLPEELRTLNEQRNKAAHPTRAFLRLETSGFGPELTQSSPAILRLISFGKSA